MLQYIVLAKSKGVHCEVESEGSWRQTFEPTNRNCVRGIMMRVMLHKKQKPNTVWGVVM